jgi:ABC-type glycerol-3-phosphate transport system substrate-binding protein
VSVWTAWEADRVADLSALLESFHQQHPRVLVNLTYFRPEALLEAYALAVREGVGPTVLIGPSAWGPSLLRQGLIVDIAPRVFPAQREAVPALLWSQVSDAGAVVGLPVRARGMVLYRNRNLAAQPAPTLQDLLNRAAETSSRFAAEPVFDLGFEFSGAQLTPCGGTVLRAGGGLGFDEAAGVCWLTLLARFRQAGPLVFDSSVDRATFMAGHSPWLIDSTDALPEIVATLGAENLSIDAWPAVDEDGVPLSGTVWTDNAYFAGGTPASDVEASWALVNLIIGPEGQERLAQADGSWFLPVARNVQPLEPLGIQAASALLEATAMPLAANIDTYTLPLERAVVAVVARAEDPAAALRRATELIRNELTQSPPGG